ncbi:beta-N-acetylhexosaminidase [Enterovibrio norvegicus FF-33]|uniref:family 20 glycosylhydrolase n=1 Tax=Enterovibrio norvegicus TaxID=188144 RepID=UPI0002F19AA0|nr:family 20 glycosylhydrolase [Enterovibrio norvegicus]OEE70248.1 beta-N-acetylhexosaminidase [Enterovibrio norvegicus FF-33]OEE88855.1 beta-N-acetylhexosaminidase [Enterovibrio norvegicus FF-162]
MKKSAISLLISAALLSPVTLADAPNTDLQLMPYPSSVFLQEGNTEINQDFSLFISGYSSERVEKLSQRIIDRVQKQTGLLLNNPIAEKQSDATLVIDIKAASTSLVQTIDTDESYKITSKNGQITLSSAYPDGAIDGAETFLQLITTDANSTSVPNVIIDDEPRFKHRGLLIDSSRHFVELETIKRQIDGMASAKLNVLHWHLTDDQGWRIESKAYPLLQETSLGGQFYTQEELKDVVAYARDRGIRVIPEINLPSHASQIVKAYPNLGSGDASNYEGTAEWGVFPPLLDPTNPDVFTFVDAIVSEMAAIFPDKSLHIGGDEPLYGEWEKNAKIQAYMKEQGIKDPRALQAYFNAKVQEILAKYDKDMSGWDEIFHPDLPKTITIQSWRGHESLADAAKEGYTGILSTGYYIDQPQPTSYHYRNDPMPSGLTVDDALHSGETFETYTWSKPRGKGSDRTGTLTIITDKNGQARAFTDYAGKPRAEVVVTEYEAGKRFVGHFDNFMSYTNFVLDMENGMIEGETSYQVIGNVRWPTFGDKTAGTDMAGTVIPDNIKPFTLPKNLEKQILGGEMTLWAENVSDETLSVRLYPRAYAIAERLWSPKELTDEDSMYERIQSVSAWATVSVGLDHETTPYTMRVRLAGTTDVTALNTLATYIEPAQYYARNWIKFNNGVYHQFERLNRYVDTLPVESYRIRDMEKLALSNEEKDILTLQGDFYKIIANHNAVVSLMANNHAMKDSIPVAEHAFAMAKLGNLLISKKLSNETLNRAEFTKYAKQISDSAQPQDEIIVALVRPVEVLLQSLKK